MNGCCKIVTHCIYRYLCCPFLWEAELTRRYAAESNAFCPIRVRQCEAGMVTIRQFLFLFKGRFPVTDYRTDRVQYISNRQVIAFGYLGAARSFRVSLHPHLLVTLQAQLYASRRMNGIVNATVQRHETPQQGIVGSIDDGVRLQPGYIPLPYPKPVFRLAQWDVR